MDDDLGVGSIPPEESGNRVFLIGTIILGGVFLLALVAIVVLFLLTRGGGGPAQPAVNLTATFVFQLGGTQTAAANATQQKAASQTAAITVMPTLTPTATRTMTQTPSPVVFSTLAMTETPTVETAVVGATTAATVTGGGAAASPTKTAAPAATALPATGFGEEAGLPGLLALAGLFLLIIILARQLRAGGSRT